MPKIKFKPFDRVLVRSSDKYKNDNYPWKIDIFSNEEHIKFDDGTDTVIYRTLTGTYDNCLPYEGNEHLLRSTDTPVTEDNIVFGEPVKVRDDYLDKWVDGIFIKLNADSDGYAALGYKYTVATKTNDDARVGVWKQCKKA